MLLMWDVEWFVLSSAMPNLRADPRKAMPVESDTGIACVKVGEVPLGVVFGCSSVPVNSEIRRCRRREIASPSSPAEYACYFARASSVRADLVCALCASTCASLGDSWEVSGC